MEEYATGEKLEESTLESTQNIVVDEAIRKERVKHQITHISIVLVLIAIISLCVINFLVLQSESLNTPEAIKTTETEEVQVQTDLGALFTSNIKNISFRIPAGWSFVTPENVDFPYGTTSPWFAITNESNGCSIASFSDWQNSDAYFPERALPIHVSDPVMSPEYQFLTYGYSTKDQVSVSDKDQTKQLVIASSYPSNRFDDFYLWEKDQNDLSRECIMSLLALLGTVTTHFEDINLSTTTEGHLWVQYVRSGLQEQNEEVMLMLTTSSHETYKVLNLERKTASLEGTFFVKDGRLYTIENSSYSEVGNVWGRIMVIDPFKKTIEVLPGTEMQEQMYSLYLHNDLVYFTTGGSECGKQCEGDLYSVSVTGGSPTLIKKAIRGSIWKMGDDGNTLWTSEGYGDAGCWSSSRYVYNFLRGTQTQHSSESGCWEEENTKTIYDSSIQPPTDTDPISYSVYIRDGVLLASEQNFEYSFGNYSMVK